MKKSLILTSLFIFGVLAVNGQSTSNEVERLRKRAKENEQIAKQAEVRALEAEVEVKRMQQLALANEQLAKQSELRAIKAENQVRSIRCLAISNELAEQSVEIQDRELAALLAVQAYNLNVNNGGYTFSTKMYNALFSALKKNALAPGNSEAAKSFLKNANSKPTFSAALPNSQNSVIAEKNGNLKFVTEQGTTVRILAGHRAQVDQITFSNSGKLMATSGKDNSIRIWNLNQLNFRPIVILENDLISKLAFSVDDTQIMFALGKKKAAFNQRPVEVKQMAADLCSMLTRNLTKEEWSAFVGDDFPYEETCPKN